VVDATNKALGKILATDQHHVIPLFQRPYVWDQGGNWEPMWKDIRKAAEDVEYEQSLEHEILNPPTYFLGAVVIQDRRRQTQRLASSHIIDGQQRMTTLQVLLAAARAVASSAGAGDVARVFGSLIENRSKPISDDHPQDRYKVWPLPQDREAYLWAVRDPEHEDPKISDRKHRLVRAREWFEEEIREWSELSGDPSRRLESLSFAIEERIQVVEILLGTTDDPQVIFEALNHRGVPLAAGDLVKNLLFQTVEKQGDASRAEELFSTGWMPLDAKPWRNKVTTGRIQRVLLDLLLAYWLTIQTEQEVLVDHLFADFKRWMLDRNARASDVIVDVRHHADTYGRLPTLPDGTATASLLDRMAATGTTTPWPVILYLHANPSIPDEQRATAARAIDSFLMRRAVCGMTTKDYNRLFVTVLIAAQRSQPAVAGEEVSRVLSSQTADSRLWPTDAEFMSSLMGSDVYRRLVQSRLKALLAGIENHVRTTRTEPAAQLTSREARLNIEHVMPQKWEVNWPLDTPADEGTLDKRISAVHQLGNLTLTTTNINQEMSNRAWLEKRELLNSHSLLRLTTGSILTAPEGVTGEARSNWASAWNEDRIATRSWWLTCQAVEIWPGPTKHHEAGE